MPENNHSNEFDFRVIVLMPTGRDGALVRQTLENGNIDAKICETFQELEDSLDEGAGSILIAEEALYRKDFKHLVKIIQQQPIWSDIPVVLLAATERNTENLLNSVGTLLNITIVERPLPKAILISAMRGALRARRKQYQTRNLLAELKESDTQKDLFLATLSHELRTPLNSMLGWIKLLKSNTDEKFDKHHALEVIERNANAQTQIINDILLLSRIVTGKFEISRKEIDLNLVIRAAIDVVRPAADEKQIKIETVFSDDSCQVIGDDDRLQQVLWNLLTNSIKFTPPNGHIRVATNCEDDLISIEISDNGQGIKQEFLPVIFERFRQVDNSYTRAFGGLGLGLSIVRSIVEQHSGTIAVESDGEGQGASFKVKIPRLIIDNDMKSMPLNSLETQKSLAGLRVLIAEDDDDSREMLIYLLEQYNFRIEAVSCATDALRSISKRPPHIVISDVGMPDMDGFEMIKKIRRLAPEQGGLVPAIALTGYAGSQDRNKALEAGYQAHLSKPIDFDKLLKTIEEVIGNQKDVV